MGSFCSNVRPRYKHYVIGVFEGNIDDLCSFAKLYPRELPRIGRYLVKQLNIRLSNVRKSSINKDIKLAMEAWNNLVYSCNSHIDKFETHILQSIILLFAEHTIELHLCAMKTLRKYVPYSSKISQNENLSFIDSCTLLSDSQDPLIRINALKTLSVIFTHLNCDGRSQFCPDLYTKYSEIIHSILLNLNINSIDNKNNENIIEYNECDIYAQLCYEKFCSLISANQLHNFLNSLSSILIDHCEWHPTKFCVKLLDTLIDKSSSISSILVVEEILIFVSTITDNHDDNDDAYFIDIMNSIIIVLQQFSSRVINTKNTFINRNSIISKLCYLLHIIDSVSVKTDSIDIGTERILIFAKNLLDCMQCYIVNISYIDSESILLRMIKHLISSKSFIHTQLQLKCILRTTAHRIGKINSSKHTKHEIIRKILKFHLKQQHNEHCNLVIDLVQLSIQNILILSQYNNNNETTKTHSIGFNQTQWANERIIHFLESQIIDNSRSPSHASSITSSSLDESASFYYHSAHLVSTLSNQQRQWIYATMYSYLENSNYFESDTLLRITNTIIIVALSSSYSNFDDNKSRKITSEVIDFDDLLPLLLLIQKLGNQYHDEYIKNNQDVNNKRSCRESVMCHSIILSVLLYIRHFLHCMYSPKSNYKILFYQFCQIIDDIYTKCKKDKQIMSNFEVSENGLLKINCYSEFEDNNTHKQITHIMPFELLIQSLNAYGELIHQRRLSRCSLTINDSNSFKDILKKEFPINDILDDLNRETENDINNIETASFSCINSNMYRQYNYVNSITSAGNDSKMNYYNLDPTQPIKVITSLDTFNNFQEIVDEYIDNIDNIKHVIFTLTSSNTDNINKDIAPPSFDFGDIDEITSTNSNDIHLQQQQHMFFKPFITDNYDKEYNLMEFYVQHENDENPSVLLHNGLCNRLDLIFHDEFNRLEIECDLDYMDYTFLANNKVVDDNKFNNNNQESLQSPMRQMRQLKAKGKDALNRVKYKTKQFTHSIPNFGRKTRQGSRVIKEKFITVKTKIQQQTTKIQQQTTKKYKKYIKEQQFNLKDKNNNENECEMVECFDDISLFRQPPTIYDDDYSNSISTEVCMSDTSINTV